MPVQDYFEAPVAYNPDADQLVAGASFQVFAATDSALSTPLTPLDAVSGTPIANLRSSSIGVLPAFRVAGDPPQVILKSGSFTTLVTSKYGIFLDVMPDPELLAQAVASAGLAETALGLTLTARDIALQAASDAAALTFRRRDTGRSLMSKLKQGRDAVLAFAGDSLGTSTAAPPAGEYPWLTAVWLGETFPKLRIEFFNHDFAGGGYQPMQLVQAGAPAVAGGEIASTGKVTSVEDTFSYTAADVVGQTPSVAGVAWASNGSNANGDWSAAGAGAVASADGTVGYLLQASNTGGASTNADHWVRATVVKAASNPAGGAFRRIDVGGKYVDTSNMLRAKYTQHSDGDVEVSIESVIGGTITTHATTGKFTPGPSTDIQAQFGPTTFVLVDGTRELTATFSASLFQSGGALYSPTGTRLLLRKLSDAAGVKVTSFRGGRADAIRVQKLTIYNGCRAGSTFSYQVTNAATLYPVPFDFMFATSSHNYGSDADAYLIGVRTFAEAMKTISPSGGMAFGSENPEFPPIASANRGLHANRALAIAQFSQTEGYGYVPGFEAFSEYPDAGTWLVDPDGIHPLESVPVGSPYSFTGAQLFAAQFTGYLQRELGAITFPAPA